MSSVRLSRNIFRYFKVTTSENTDFYILTLPLFPRTSYVHEGKMRVSHNQTEILRNLPCIFRA